MTNLSTKVKLYATDNGVNSLDFLSDVLLFDEGNGAYIKEWNLDIPEPTDAQLAQYESQGLTSLTRLRRGIRSHERNSSRPNQQH